MEYIIWTHDWIQEMSGLCGFIKLLELDGSSGLINLGASNLVKNKFGKHNENNKPTYEIIQHRKNH